MITCGGGFMEQGTVSEKDRIKYRAAQECGLLNRLLDVGWAGLSAKETGMIGGRCAQIRKTNGNE